MSGYAREVPMKFTDRRREKRQIVVGEYTEIVKEEGKLDREVVRPIKLYVGRKALEVKGCL